MGQRVVAARDESELRRSARLASIGRTARPSCSLCVFPTDLGWFGLIGCDGVVHRLLIGQASADDVRQDLEARSAADASVSAIEAESDWHPDLRRSLQNFARGIREDFADVPIDFSRSTAFRRRVLQHAQRIPYGSTVSYGELGRQVGAPQGARAVGGAMATNPVPILIPCHRVIASGGAIGGFTARQGVDLKRRLLEMESAARIG